MVGPVPPLRGGIPPAAPLRGAGCGGGATWGIVGSGAATVAPGLRQGCGGGATWGIVGSGAATVAPGLCRGRGGPPRLTTWGAVGSGAATMAPGLRRGRGRPPQADHLGGCGIRRGHCGRGLMSELGLGLGHCRFCATWVRGRASRAAAMAAALEKIEFDPRPMAAAEKVPNLR